MSVDSTSFISTQPRVIAEFGDTGPESLDNATPILVRTRRSTLSLVFSFDGNPGNWEAGVSVSIDGITFVEPYPAITGSGISPVEFQIPDCVWVWIQPFQQSKDNDVLMTITAKLL